jgi:hypothetical protein
MPPTPADPPDPKVEPNGFDAADFKRRLADEYKILQDKIDKIGSFRFTIKGWSVTAVIASAAVSSSSSLLTVAMISVGLALMLCFFFWFEFKQVELSRLFGDRARRLENSFRQMDRRSALQIREIFVPYTAHEIAWAGRKRAALPGNNRQRSFAKWCDDLWQVARQADICFYAVLICVAFLLPLVPRHAAISAHWKHWTEDRRSTSGGQR